MPRLLSIGSHWNLPSGQGIYVYVEDLDTHFERARANGAKIVYPR